MLKEVKIVESNEMGKNSEPSADEAGHTGMPARGIYLLPNLFTTASLFAGFYAIVAAMKSAFGAASIAVFIAMIMDGLDGRVARLTNTQSAFGTEYDSLSDMVASGVAPALVAYSWSLGQLGKPGWLAAFIFTAAVALRLARFNTQTDIVDKRYFRGLPCPAAAGVVAGLVWYCHDNIVRMEQASAWGVAVLMGSLAVLMVSNIQYFSFKNIDFARRVPFIAIILVILLFVLVSINPPVFCLGFFTCYALSGPLCALYRWLFGRRVI